MHPLLVLLTVVLTIVATLVVSYEIEVRRINGLFQGACDAPSTKPQDLHASASGSACINALLTHSNFTYEWFCTKPSPSDWVPDGSSLVLSLFSIGGALSF